MKPIHDNLKAVRIEDDETGDLANGPESSSSLFQPQSTAFVSSQGS